MTPEKAYKYILSLERNYRELKMRGACTIDINVIINDLMLARIASDIKISGE